MTIRVHVCQSTPEGAGHDESHDHMMIAMTIFHDYHGVNHAT